MDVAKEIAKLDGKKEKLNGQLAKLKEAMEITDYCSKVQVNTRFQFPNDTDSFLKFRKSCLCDFLRVFRYPRMFSNKIQKRFVVFSSLD